MVIAIDGPAGVGKSTIAKMLADKLGYLFLNSGKFYRAITWAVLKNGINPESAPAVIKIAENLDFDIRDGELYVSGKPAGDELQSDEVESRVAELSAIPPVRHIVNEKLRKLAQNLNIVMEGRDITTVVFPHAEHKIYLDASIESRAKRRFLQGTSQQSLEELTDSIAKRDEIDKNKKEGRLQIAPDAFYLDTSDLTIDEVCEKVLVSIKSKK